MNGKPAPAPQIPNYIGFGIVGVLNLIFYITAAVLVARWLL